MAVKLSSVKVDLERELKGDWVEYPDFPGVSFNVSSLIIPAYQIERDQLLARLTRQYKGKTPPDVVTSELGKLYHKHILHGWRGFDEEYSRDKAAEMLADPRWRKLVAAVEWCAARISTDEVEFVEDTAKNSAKASATG
jgi:hypothetical protein